MKTEILGLTVLDEFVIKCGDCGLPLINVVLTETNEQRENRGLKRLSSQFKVIDCPKCQGSSFITKVLNGSTAINPAKENTNIEVIDTDILDNIIITTLKVKND